MQKGFAPIIILVGILVIVAIGGAFYLSKSQTPQPTTTTGSSAPIGTEETANWKTYTDQSGDFMLKYPPHLKLVERKFPYGSFFDLTDMTVKPDGTVTDDDILFSQAGGVGGEGSVSIEKGFSLTPYKQQKAEANDTIKLYRSGFRNPQKIIVDGKEAYKIVEKSSGGGFEGEEITVFVINGENVYVLASNTFLSSKKEYENLFNQIFSTFKFLDQKDRTEVVSPLTLQDVMEIKAKYGEQLLEIDNVVGHGISTCGGKYCIEVYLEKDDIKTRNQIPDNLDGVPVRIKVTGEIRAL